MGYSRTHAAEVIIERANAEKPFTGLTSWVKFPDGKIQKYDVSIAKNYLDIEELNSLEMIVTMNLDYAEYQARRNIPMTMKDWKNRLDSFLVFNEHEILHDKGKVSHEIAKSFAESEFEKYRVIQDRLFQNDFDRFIDELSSKVKESQAEQDYDSNEETYDDYLYEGENKEEFEL